MGTLRFFAGSPIAMVVTVVLFLVMFGLIRQEMQMADPVERPVLTIGRQIVDTPPARPVQRIVEFPPPPPVVTTTRTRETDPTGPTIAPPAVPTTITEIGPVSLTGLQPLIRIPPSYPQSCAARNLSGRVVVQYDVTNGGAVTNVRVISATDRCFERNARQTIEGWKYRPSTGATSGLQASDLTQTLVYDLENP
ncbi:TonB family protein [Parvularcula sp. LCG005]|uniref:TonB family protein n=1 Tax=Parvularcula sp. LCG005 TaxID=3078805 RepID=UPI0029420BD9|nr:TonB family protein [Parvularcula sp. LCG005]WOI53957.1 TonB family protein [Parvularcula sp. LCG005]